MVPCCRAASRVVVWALPTSFFRPAVISYSAVDRKQSGSGARGAVPRGTRLDRTLDPEGRQQAQQNPRRGTIRGTLAERLQVMVAEDHGVGNLVVM